MKHWIPLYEAGIKENCGRVEGIKNGTQMKPGRISWSGLPSLRTCGISKWIYPIALKLEV